MSASATPIVQRAPPPSLAIQLDKEPEIVETAPEEHPTDSHELANADHEEKGAAQHEHRQTEVRDLGWNELSEDVPTPLVGGLPNEELWTLVRRFNKARLIRKSYSVTNIDIIPANIPCQIPSRASSWWARPQYCRRRRVLPRQITSQY